MRSLLLALALSVPSAAQFGLVDYPPYNVDLPPTASVIEWNGETCILVWVPRTGATWGPLVRVWGQNMGRSAMLTVTVAQYMILDSRPCAVGSQFWIHDVFGSCSAWSGGAYANTLNTSTQFGVPARAYLTPPPTAIANWTMDYDSYCGEGVFNCPKTGRESLLPDLAALVLRVRAK